MEFISHNCAITMDSDWVKRMSFSNRRTGQSTETADFFISTRLYCSSPG
ncbi:hypothetical protein PRUB_a4299 [Pseudoalteromonas rubra]|uniref:Uncharacterized protein n=1 Tax=Pseudoalteromonas rubra TaxID=43658 RepID=A0A8T0C4C4_9GAMM|nr:hypothetical protein PRUB_a4299 [Pseudoalteromonas rubra]